MKAMPVREVPTREIPMRAMRARVTAKIARQEVDDIQPEDWVLDSAATHFFCADKAQFETLDVDAAEEEISMANGDIVRSAGHGTVRLLVNGKNHQGKRTPHELLLHEVVYAPALEVNLLSIWMLNEMGLRVVADGKDSEIQLREDHEVIANLVPINNLYFLDIVEDPPMLAAAAKKPNRRQKQNLIKSIKIWHRRLGHLNLKHVKNISRITLGVGFHKAAEWEAEAEAICKACVQGKQVRKQVPKKQQNQSKQPFDLIYSNICGPFPILKDKSCYFITFTNDFICYIWIKVIVIKAEALTVFMQFYLEIKTQFNKKIKWI